MSEPTKCDRCWQVDCPTLVYDKGPITKNGQTYHGHLGWSTAFQACATMGIRMELKLLRPYVVNLLRHAVSR